MKNLFKQFVAALAIVAGVAVLPAQVAAQTLTTGGIQIVPFRSLAASEIYTAVLTQPLMYVKYVGTAAGAATVAVAANGDVAFIANGSADTTINQAGTVCGATPGTLQLSAAPAGCNTLGKTVDLINASPNWVAALHGALRSDSSTDTIATISATDAKGPAGLALFNDQAVTLTQTVVVVPKATGGGAANGVSAYGVAPGADLGITAYTYNNKVISNPFSDRDTTLLYAAETITTTDNAGNLMKVLCVVPNNQAGRGTTGALIPTGSETVTELFRKAVAATTTQGILNEFVNAGGLTCNQGKLLYRINGNTTLTAPSVFATGFVRFRQ